jgi:hypothetical protein
MKKIHIIYSFYKFKLISSFKIFTVVFVCICRYSIQWYTPKKAKRLVVAFVRYALIVLGAFDGGTTKLGN